MSIAKNPKPPNQNQQEKHKTN
uniref:Uncharacterized protein n=1 Tax=Rhizophora mucronata TaxID=61149 RepID=A0A2P2QQP6_RHIMU